MATLNHGLANKLSIYFLYKHCISIHTIFKITNLHIQKKYYYGFTLSECISACTYILILIEEEVKLVHREAVMLEQMASLQMLK